MGWVGCADDNQDRIDENRRDNANNYSLATPREIKTIYYDCPYCDSSFVKHNDLYSHIKADHNILRPLIKINDKIVTYAKKIFITSINSASIFLYGCNNPISLNDNKINIVGDDIIDITKQVCDIVDNEKECTIKIGKYEILVSKYKIEHIRYKQLLEIINKWSKETEQHIPLSLYDGFDFNDSEVWFLNGFYNYFIACNALFSDKIKRYDDAFSIISGFDSPQPIAVLLLKIIAFRRNWINSLKSLCKFKDQFSLAASFFSNSKDNLSPQNIGNNCNQLFIEDDILENLEAINDYMNGKKDSVDLYIQKHKNIDNIEDINMRDRIYFLKAKRYLDNHEKEKSKHVLGEIKTECFKL